jgi:hypothetical protein
LTHASAAVGAYALTEEEDVWEAIRAFFRGQAQDAA